MSAVRALLEMEYAEATIAWTRDALELTDAELARVLSVDRKTVQRWRERQSVPSTTHRRGMEKLNQLRHLLDTSFHTPDDAKGWLHRPSPELIGRTPLAVLADGEVDAILGLLSTGVIPHTFRNNAPSSPATSLRAKR